jgi:hypothetical protein
MVEKDADTWIWQRLFIAVLYSSSHAQISWVYPLVVGVLLSAFILDVALVVALK